MTLVDGGRNVRRSVPGEWAEFEIRLLRRAKLPLRESTDGAEHKVPKVPRKQNMVL